MNGTGEEPADRAISKLPGFLIPEATSEAAAAAMWRHFLSATSNLSGAPGAPGGALVATDEPRWVHLDNLGRPSMVCLDRHDLVHALKLRYRDLVVVDPTLPLDVASVLLVRTRAMVVNLDVGGDIRMVICENQCFVLSLPKITDPGVTALPTLDHPFVRRLSQCLAVNASHSSAALLTAGTEQQQQKGSKHSLLKPGGNGGGNGGSVEIESMPYELRALEVALSTAIGILSAEVATVEEISRPAIENMLFHVERQTLEAVRRVKNAVDKLTAKVGRLHQELSELLEDDEDMCDMYLKRRAETLGLAPLPQPWEEELDSDSEEGEESRTESRGEERRRQRRRRALAMDVSRGGAENRNTRRNLGTNHQGVFDTSSRPGSEARNSSRQDSRIRRRRSEPLVDQEGGDEGQRLVQYDDSLESIVSDHADDQSMTSTEADAALEEAEEALMQNHGGGGGHDNGRSNGASSPSKLRATVHPHDIEEAEDLLESMFVRADLLMRRLRIIDEKIDDAEDFLELDLDQRRNELVGLNLIVATVAMSLGFAAAIGGFFGMNLINSELAAVWWVLPLVLILTVAVAVALSVLVFVYVRKRKLMFIPTSL